ncbi:hypothetical protein IJ579_02355 [bacterium]|nr:hypothetical protein [bacterium]
MEVIEIKDYKKLAYGENSHQAASIATVKNGLSYEVLSHSKDLNYIDFLNLSEAVKIMAEFFDVNSAVITKEALICGVALGATLDEAFSKVIDCDPLSCVNSSVGFTKSVTLNIAKQLYSMKIKNVIAPDFDKDAFKYLLDTNINIVKVNSPLHEVQGFDAKDIKVTPFGILVQDQNLNKLSKENFIVVSQVKPTQEQVEDAIFAWKVSKHLKSKSAVVAKDLATHAIIQGKTNGSLSTEMAMDYSCECSKDAVLALDGTIKNPETINAAVQGRIGLIIETGSGKNSKEILKLADKYGLSVIHTKMENKRY